MRGYDVYTPQKCQKSWWMDVNSNRDDRLGKARDWESKYEVDRLAESFPTMEEK